MPINLTKAQRKTISLEILDLPVIVKSTNDANSDLSNVRDALLSKDANIKIFYDKYNDSINAYQSEQRWLDGTTYTEVLDSQIQSSAARENGNLYFPVSESFAWINYQPYINPSSTNLKGQPISSSSDHEQEITSNIENVLGLQYLINLLLNGAAGSGSDTGSFNGSSSLTTLLGMFSIGSYVEIGGVLLHLDSLQMDGITYNVTLILGSGAQSGTIIGGTPAYSNTQRNSLIGPQQAFLTNLSNEIITRISDWETSVNNQLTQLNSNEDDRSPQSTEIASAITNANNTISIINTWQALPNTGTTGNDSKFTDNQLSPIQSEISNRSTFASTRASQVITALGNLSQSANGSFSGSGLFYLRYQQLNNRINIIGGPLTEYYEKNKATDALQQLADTKNSQLNTFNAQMKVQALSANGKGTNVINVADTSVFSTSDTVYLVSETQAELNGTIVSIDSATQMSLSFVVSADYTISDVARIFKLF